MTRPFLILSLCFLCGASIFHTALVRFECPLDTDTAQQRELLLIPDPQSARAISLGYRTVLADLLWFRTIEYFGRHIEEDRDIHRLDSLCSSIIALNPKAKHVSIFCAQMLAWELKQVARARYYLTGAIGYYPDDWFLYYLRGFFALHFLKDKGEAYADLAKAASFPESPSVVQRLAASQMATLEGPQQAILFLDVLIARTTDDSARTSLIRRRDELSEQLQSESSSALNEQRIGKGGA